MNKDAVFIEKAGDLEDNVKDKRADWRASSNTTRIRTG